MAEKPRYELKELLELMKIHKILTLKMGGLELELHPSAFESQEVAVQEGAPKVEDEEFSRVPTAEEFLFMAGLNFEAPDEPKGDA